MNMKERIDNINRVAAVNFDRAQGMLDMLNDIYGTRFGWLNRRVVIFENPDAGTAAKYAHCHDAFMWLNSPIYD